jgi:hypothetical protein
MSTKDVNWALILPRLAPHDIPIGSWGATLERRCSGRG